MLTLNRRGDLQSEEFFKFHHTDVFPDLEVISCDCERLIKELLTTNSNRSCAVLIREKDMALDKVSELAKSSQGVPFVVIGRGESDNPGEEIKRSGYIIVRKNQEEEPYIQALRGALIFQGFKLPS
jgi:hypothetical protein